jgi:hypothetical protein
MPREPCAFAGSLQEAGLPSFWGTLEALPWVDIGLYITHHRFIFDRRIHATGTGQIIRFELREMLVAPVNKASSEWLQN